MRKENCKHSDVWDFNCEYSPNSLISKMNQMANKILKENHFAGANVIVIHPNIDKLIKSMEFYYFERDNVGGRYMIVRDNNVEDNTVFVTRKEIIGIEALFVPFLKPLDDNPEFSEVVFMDANEMEEQHVKEYKRASSGYIEIINYNNDIEP